MNPQEITTLVTTVGFPIVATYVLWIFVRQRIHASEAASLQREAAAERREGQLVERINELEHRLEGELVALIHETKDVCREARDAILRSSDVTMACTNTLNRLSQNPLSGDSPPPTPRRPH